MVAFAVVELIDKLILLYQHLFNHFFQILLILADAINSLDFLVVIFSLPKQLFFKL